MSKSSTSLAHNSGFNERSVKYIANKAAKNINSLASHTMVPIDTIFGRSAWLGTLMAVDVLTPRVYLLPRGKSPQDGQNWTDVIYCISGPFD
jgi:hypothetical protein